MENLAVVNSNFAKFTINDLVYKKLGSPCIGVAKLENQKALLQWLHTAPLSQRHVLEGILMSRFGALNALRGYQLWLMYSHVPKEDRNQVLSTFPLIEVEKHKLSDLILFLAKADVTELEYNDQGWLGTGFLEEVIDELGRRGHDLIPQLHLLTNMIRSTSDSFTEFMKTVAPE